MRILNTFVVCKVFSNGKSLQCYGDFFFFVLQFTRILIFFFAFKPFSASIKSSPIISETGHATEFLVHRITCNCSVTVRAGNIKAVVSHNFTMNTNFTRT